MQKNKFDLLFLNNNESIKKFDKKYLYFDFPIISEMQDIYPIPKDILSYFIDQIYKNGFWYVTSLNMSFLIDLAISSSNIKNVKFSLEKFFATENKEFLLICLPYKLNIWKSELNDIFSEEYIIDLFNRFNNSRGSCGYTNNGYLIILNSDYINELKDIEELVEHEFIHMFKLIDKAEIPELSFSLRKILYSDTEFDNFNANLVNRLEKIFNNYCLKNKLNDTKINRQNFLNYIFQQAKLAANETELIDEIQQYDSSKQLNINMLYLWSMINIKPPEFKQFKQDIENSFIN